MWVLVFGLSGVSSSRSSIGTITLYVDYELQYDLLSVKRMMAGIIMWPEHQVVHNNSEMNVPVHLSFLIT
jgi:hypothetical protein